MTALRNEIFGWAVRYDFWKKIPTDIWVDGDLQKGLGRK